MKNISVSIAFFWALAASFLSGTLDAQTVNGVVKGALTDPGAAAVPAAGIELRNDATGASLRTSSSAAGLFVFPSVPPATYTLTVEAKGFQRHSLTGLQVISSETRDLGQIELALGQLQQTVTVADTAAALQAASSERSGLVSGSQLEELALKGRDFMALMQLIPGVVDTRGASRDATSPEAVAGISINGGRPEMKNFTVDGIGALDTGSNNTVHYQPNMDTIAEVKVLTSNYQAEYGRSAAGVISVVTRSGSQEFHGTGWWTHRHEQFNANEFFRNRSGLDKAPYRYNIAGFSIGGPAYIPGRFNTGKNRLFFFASQEYTRQKVDFGNQFRTMPTELERRGDFSRSLDVSGRMIPVLDPTTGAPFTGNAVPASRINPLGQSILKFFPLPNFTDPDPARRNNWNYRTAESGTHPRRNDMVRMDAYLSSKLMGYFRWINDADDSEDPFNGYNFSYSPYLHPNPGHGYAGHFSYTISPAMLNEFTLGKGWNSWQYGPKDPKAMSREALAPIPQWFPNKTFTNVESEAVDSALMPNVAFGATPVNPPAINVNNKQHVNHNDTWDITNNFSWVKGSHTLKTGAYLSLVDKVVVAGAQWNGVLNFAVNRNNPNDSGHGFANALLGNFNSYNESVLDINIHTRNWGLEFFAQDSWRAARKLTLDYGVRFYHVGPDRDLVGTFAAFVPQAYDPAKAPRLYWPGLNANRQRVAVDRATGQTALPVMIGRFVPSAGDPANGMRVAGRDGTPKSLYTTGALNAAPRFGFAYDATGKGTSVIRAGAGLFFDRARLLMVPPTANNPPVSNSPIAYYGNLSTLAQSAGTLGPSNSAFPTPQERARIPSVLSYSFGIQQRLPFRTVLDVSYAGNISRHLLQRRNTNMIPVFSRFDPANFDTTLAGRQPLPADFFRPFAGHGDLIVYEYAASSNYNSLQVSAQRRFASGLGFGASYTFGKALGVSDVWNDLVTGYFNPRQWDYGPMSFDRSQVFTVNYYYDLPRLKSSGQARALAAITNGWTISGITAFVTGAALTPGLNTTYTTDITGSGEGARLTVVGDPYLPKSERNFFRNFRQEAFALTPVGSFGNAGVGVLRGPGINNWDLSLTRSFPLGGEARKLLFRAEFYNAFNHTQFAGLDTTARFDQTGRQVSPTFGAFNSDRNARVISFALRLRF